jgi:hypothetical protein
MNTVLILMDENILLMDPEELFVHKQVPTKYIKLAPNAFLMKVPAEKSSEECMQWLTVHLKPDFKNYKAVYILPLSGEYTELKPKGIKDFMGK